MEGREKALLIAGLAADKKAADVVILKMEGLTTFTDYFVICSGQSATHVKTISDHITEGLKARGLKPMGVEGTAGRQWVLIDCGDVVVHVFEAETRAFYELEKLWLDAPRLTLP
ncbi:MAG: ribosome silencing factor [Nitrospiraceae bacterium]|nr:ribosome silencing factor [Nitrospiraceae bacterium]